MTKKTKQLYFWYADLSSNSHTADSAVIYQCVGASFADTEYLSWSMVNASGRLSIVV